MASTKEGASTSRQLQICIRERDRRKAFKQLLKTLVSLIPPERLQGKPSISEHFEEAATYVKFLERRIIDLQAQLDDLHAKRNPNSVEIRDLGQLFQVIVQVRKEEIAHSALLMTFESHGLDIRTAQSFETSAERLTHIILCEKTESVDGADLEALNETLRRLLGNKTSVAYSDFISDPSMKAYV